MRKSGDPIFKTISDKLKEFAKKNKGKDFETIEKIIAQILEIKPEVKIQQQVQNQVHHQSQQHPNQNQQSQQHH